MNIALVQMRCEKGAVDANLTAIRDYITNGASGDGQEARSTESTCLSRLRTETLPDTLEMLIQMFCGIAAVLFGVVLAAAPLTPSERAAAVEAEGKPFVRLTRGASLAFVSAIGYGIMFWILGFQVIPALGGVAPVWLIRLLTPCLLVALAGPMRQSVRVPRMQVLWLIGAVGLLDTSAYVANTIGFTTREVAVVSVLASLFSTVTVMLAWIFLRERLHWSQWLGIGVIFIGIALVSI